jgi:radical SAM superfamily enzyme YgiQ (UPF0313 family)
MLSIRVNNNTGNYKMGKNTIVLARPGVSSQAELHWSRNFSLGLAYLASYLRDKGLQVIIIDGKVSGHLTYNETVTAIAAHDPEIVGISCMTVDYKSACLIASELKQIKKSVKIILGGAHINALPEQSLCETESVDFVIAGQAEISFYKLISSNFNKESYKDIFGLFWRDETGRICRSEIQKDGISIECLPFPAWDLYPRNSVYPVMTERGCPYSCVFCSHNLTRQIKSRSVAHVLKEVYWLKNTFQPSQIAFEDETFGLNLTRVYELLDGLKELNSDRMMSFIAQTRVDCFTEEMALKMKEAGFEYISLGIESCDSDVLAASGKNITINQITEAVKIARKTHLKLWLKFIIGLPGETKKSVKTTIGYASKFNPEMMSVASIVAYPGSMVYEWAKNNEKGYRLLTDDWNKFDKYLSTSVELQNLSSVQIKKLQLRMYLEVYLRNFRFREVFAIVLNNLDVFKRMFSQLIAKKKYKIE